jgi:hypothetical protein
LFSKHAKTKVNGVFRDGFNYEIHARPMINHMDQAQFPLLKRGWVFQERLLAPRVLHFGPQELWWECLEHVDCECSGICSGAFYSTGQEKFLSKMTHQKALADSALPQVSRRWHEIVEEFSQLGFTKARDKFPALSGIAEQINQFHNGTYLAGLWRDTLITDLLWYRLDPSTASSTEKWRAPSWSWASMDGPVKFFDSPHFLESPNLSKSTGITQSLKGVFLEIKDASTHLVSDNPFGEVTSAHIRITGFLVPVRVFDARSTSSRSLGRRLRQGRLRPGQYEFRFEGGDDGLISYIFSADYDLRSHDNNFNESNYAVLSLAQDEDGDDYALILKCIHSAQKIYERVGLLTTKFHRWRTTEHLELYNATFKKSNKPQEITLV